MADMTFKKQASQTKIERILAMITDNPMSAHDLADALHLSKRWVTEYLYHLRDEDKAHIKDWPRKATQCEKLYPRPRWIAGPGIDAPRPAPITSKMKQAMLRQRRGIAPKKPMTMWIGGAPL